jgi:hypothetical protein
LGRRPERLSHASSSRADAASAAAIVRSGRRAVGVGRRGGDLAFGPQPIRELRVGPSNVSRQRVAAHRLVGGEVAPNPVVGVLWSCLRRRLLRYRSLYCRFGSTAGSRREREGGEDDHPGQEVSRPNYHAASIMADGGLP